MKPFPRHNATHELGTSFDKPSWLLMWEVDWKTSTKANVWESGALELEEILT